MPLSKQHKARTRARIVRSAGRAFRRVGFHAVGVDAVMAGAGLTRGGFYAHFRSKDDLFAEVVGSDHGLIRMLAAREAKTPGRWRAQTLRLLRDYLNADHLVEVAPNCSFAALTADASRGSKAVRTAYRRAFEELTAQLLRRCVGESSTLAGARATPTQHAAVTQAASIAIGSVIIAAALGAGPVAEVALDGAWRSVHRILRKHFGSQR